MKLLAVRSHGEYLEHEEQYLKRRIWRGSPIWYAHAKTEFAEGYVIQTMPEAENQEELEEIYQKEIIGK